MRYNIENRASNPVGTLISILIFVFLVVWGLSEVGVVSTGSLFLWTIIILVLVFLIGGLRIVDQYERGVVLTLGKYSGTREPGLTWIFLGIQRMIKIDLRVATVDIPDQEVITKDNVTLRINAVVYFRVKNAEKAILEVQDFRSAVILYAQAALRDLIGREELDFTLAEREKISNEIKQIVDLATDPWGIDVSDIKLQDIILPEDMKRAMAKQAEAERERRAVIINAEGEYTAAEKLAMAAERLSAVKGGISIRTLETIEKISNNPSKTIIFPMPVDLFDAVKKLTGHDKQ